MKNLTPKERRFVDEYITHLNATKAAIAAGYAKGSARQTASRIMSIDYIKAAVKAGMDELARETRVTAYMIIDELKKIALSDIGEAFNENGTLLPFSTMPEDVRKAISGVDVEELFEGFGQDRTWTGYTKKLRFWPKDRALELLGKHLGTFKPDDSDKPIRTFTLNYNVKGK